MDISKTYQEQKAGDNSSQYQQIGDNSNQTAIGTQINNSVVYNGIQYPDIVSLTSTISSQVTAQSISLCTEIASTKASEKISEFEKIWIPRISKMENVIDDIVDPKFHFMLRDANISAAQSTRREDLDMLSELLACHIEKGKDLIIDAGIKRAIEIIHEVDNDSLCALTIVVSLLNTVPNSGSISKGIEFRNELFSKLLYTNLPKGQNWIEHLSVLNAIRIKEGKFYKLSRLLKDRCTGYICAGIKEGSDEHSKATEILIKEGYDKNNLAPNECLSGYLRLEIVQLENLPNCLKPILQLYTKDQGLIDEANTNFMKKWNSYAALDTISRWFESLPCWFISTSIGLALAQTNAKRCDHSFPDLI